MNKLAALIYFVFITTATTTSQAALITEDWNTVGDGKITFDSLSNLEWLDLTESNGLSFNAASLQFGTGGKFDGWRHATFDEVEGILSQFGFKSGTTGLADVPVLHDALGMMTSFLGNTCNGQAWNICANGFTKKTDTGTVHQLGAYLDVEDHWPLPVVNLVGWTTVPSVNSDPNMASIITGNFLVRTPSTVPIPTAAWLFGSGLLGLLGFTRRRKVA